MKKKFLNKSWVVGLTVLFIIGGLTSNIGADDNGQPITKNAWYIDSNAVPPYEGSPDHPFKFIWQGIENASSDDELKIRGIFYENVIFPEGKDHLRLEVWEGEPIIDGGYEDCVIEIHDDYVVIDDINIVASGDTGRDAGVYIEEGVKRVTIMNCDISDCYFGIWSHRVRAPPVEGEVYHIYDGNVISDIIKVGIFATFSDELDILDNTVTDCGYCGILLQDCNKCTIDGNTCEDNEFGIGVDVGVDNEVKNNKCKNNDNYGFFIVSGEENQIKSNDFFDNGAENQAIWLHHKWVQTDQWTDNYWGSAKKIKFLFLVKIIPGIVRRGAFEHPRFWFELNPARQEH